VEAPAALIGRNSHPREGFSHTAPGNHRVGQPILILSGSGLRSHVLIGKMSRFNRTRVPGFQNVLRIAPTVFGRDGTGQVLKIYCGQPAHGDSPIIVSKTTAGMTTGYYKFRYKSSIEPPDQGKNTHSLGHDQGGIAKNCQCDRSAPTPPGGYARKARNVDSQLFVIFNPHPYNNVTQKSTFILFSLTVPYIHNFIILPPVLKVLFYLSYPQLLDLLEFTVQSAR
jgi:hypothetical protein